MFTKNKRNEQVEHDNKLRLDALLNSKVLVK